MHCSACVGLQYGLPVGLLASWAVWTVWRLTYLRHRWFRLHPVERNL